ncbi:hypothetical protein [Aeromicrobium sp.]|uniref:hypothetical protein n=1 Tax=Aeromicrobium sp. TaxID=1871063 RepID=UPI0025BF4F0E|nr:hypothetical protein [Aeromicrobium sp.]MCK5892275.1 hypothetical protein [Aeromicrobium sp.]
MNRIARTLATSAPLVAALAVGGLTLGAGAAAAEPVPLGPTTLAVPDPGPVDPNLPDGPGDLTNPEPGPVDPTVPDGPDDLTAPTPCPTHGDCGPDPVDGPDDFTAGDPEPGDPGDDSSGGAGQDGSSVPTPTRVDAGVAPTEDGQGLEWLLLGGSLVGLSGAAYGARRLIGRAA